jgi:A/G-specific adenine glycosylase
LESELTPASISLFQRLIYEAYRKNPRRMPWRETRDPYHILVSEVMLQQTGVGRVLEKYERFLEAFPDFSTLARAPLGKVLSAWQGLGYNRRSIALRSCAKVIMEDHRGSLPDRFEDLISLPGIGPATASAILAFAFERPALLVETNVRRVFLHFFFPGKTRVRDSEIVRLVELTMDRANPRTWYYALMDYGARLGKTHPGVNQKSAHYRRQSSFIGSTRQMRGAVLRTLLGQSGFTDLDLAHRLGVPISALSPVLAQLAREGFVITKGKRISIA